MTEKEKKLKELLLRLDRPDLAKKVGKVSPETILTELSKGLPPQLRQAIEKLIAAEKQLSNTKRFANDVKNMKGCNLPELIVLESMMKGIHPETFKHNKSLPLEEKLKLPAWEMIYSLNYKEKTNDKR